MLRFLLWFPLYGKNLEAPPSISNMCGADEVLVSFIVAWVCTITYHTEFIPGSRFVEVPFGCGHIQSLRAPEDDIKEDEMKSIIHARQARLYSWLSTEAIDKLTGNEEKCVILWFTEAKDDGADDECLHIAYVVEFVRCDQYERDDDMIRQRTSSILKSVQLCCLTDNMSDQFRLDLDVWKGPERHEKMEELRRDRREIEHGSFRFGYVEFRCWMVR